MANEKVFGLQVDIVAVDKYSSVFRHVNTVMGTSQKDINKTTQAFKNFGNSNQDINKVNKSLKDMSSHQDGVKKLTSSMEQLKSTILDLGLVAASTKALKELFSLAKEAGGIQMKNIELGGIYGLDATSKQLQDINKQANELSNKTIFSTKDILEINTELGHAQIAMQNLAKVVPQATYLAEIEVGIGKSGSAKHTAYNFARMAEDAGIASDVDKMTQFADKMYRVINVTHATSESLGETFKYGMPVAKNLGWTQNDMLEASAFAAVNGMEGSMAGTHIKNFIERINPLKPLKGNNQKILSAMTESGFIGGVHTTVGKNGKIEITGFDNAALMKDKDHLKNYADMVDVLEHKHAEFIATNGNSTKITNSMGAEDLKKLKSHSKELTGQDITGGELEWAALMNRIFGEQGQDFAIISAHKQNVEKLNKSLQQQSSLEDQVTKIRESFVGQLHVLESNFKNLGISVGNQLLPEITKVMKELSPMVARAKDWIATHEALAKKIVTITAGVSAAILVFSGARLAVKTLTGLFGPLGTAIKGMTTLVTGARVKQSAPQAMMEMRANIVNLYGAEIRGGGGGVPISGAGGAGGGKGVGKAAAGEVVAGLPSRAARQAAERTANPSVLKTVGAGAAKAFGSGLKSLKIGLPVALAFGAYDVVTAPEGHKVEAGVKASGGIIGGWAGAEAGAAMGAAIGTVVPGIGNAIGLVLGGIIGGVAGSIAGDKLASTAVDAAKKRLNALQVAEEYGKNKKEKDPNSLIYHPVYAEMVNQGKELLDQQKSDTLAKYGPIDPSKIPAPPKMPTLNIPKHAQGGVFNSAHIGMIGEAGPEALIPLTNRSRGLSLWQQAGAALGVGDGGGAGGGGNVEINIHPHPHQRVEEIADEVMRRLGGAARGMAMNTGTGINIGAMG